MRPDSEHFHGMSVGALLGLAEAVLALDLIVIEAVFKGEPHDLGALRLGSAVGDQRELNAQPLHPIGGHRRVGGTSTTPRRARRYRHLPMRHRLALAAPGAGLRERGKGGRDDAAAHVTDAVAPVL